MQYVITHATGMYGYFSKPKGVRKQEKFGHTDVECTAVSC
jgi:hypothetical protein